MALEMGFTGIISPRKKWSYLTCNWLVVPTLQSASNSWMIQHELFHGNGTLNSSLGFMALSGEIHWIT